MFIEIDKKTSVRKLVKMANDIGGKLQSKGTELYLVTVNSIWIRLDIV